MKITPLFSVAKRRGFTVIELIIWTSAVAITVPLISQWCHQISLTLPMMGRVDAEQSVVRGMDHFVNDLKEADASNFSATNVGGIMVPNFLNLDVTSPLGTPWFRKQAVTAAQNISYVQYMAVASATTPQFATLMRYETTQYPPTQAGAITSIEIPQFFTPVAGTELVKFDGTNNNILVLTATFPQNEIGSHAPGVGRVIRRVSARGNDGTYAP